jgi:serine/threonine protein kinase
MPDLPSDRLRLLFERAMALPATARAAFVEHKCAADPDLGQRLRAMLAAAGDAQFEAPASPAAPLLDATLPPEPAAAGARSASHHEGPGSTIGPYRLLQMLGEGGFGAVYLAEQSQPVARQVALKILKLGMDSAQVVARFEQERQALALMDHAHIAKVFDAGTTSNGRPYFVMELCRGAPIVDYCDKNGLTIEQRLELLEQVCHAIQHAHGKGIVHRDIKPSNVLVGVQDGKPLAKVIDFGIAKAIAQPLTDRTLFTQQQQVIGTLQYMSPEQAEGSLDIDTRTDVYALGVLLYELLTGTTPFDQRTLLARGLSEMHRMIREQEPPKPSTRLHESTDTLATIAAARRVEPRRLGSLVRGELDWIAMKAIEKDRGRRYGTADALAEDLARFRRGEAVVAAPPSAAYRLRKFVRRNKALVAGAAAVAIALLAGVVAFAWQARIAADERDEARAAQTRAEETVLVMESLFKGLDPAANEAVAGSLKDQLIERLDTVAVRLDGMRDPLARARLEQSFATVRLGVGDFAKAAVAYRSVWQAR